MSTKKTRPARAAARTTAQHKTDAARAAAADTPVPVTPRTDTEAALARALDAQAECTTTELALAAGIGKSTAAKALARWEAEGAVTRFRPADGKPGPARWTHNGEVIPLNDNDGTDPDNEAAGDRVAEATQDVEAEPRLSVVPDPSTSPSSEPDDTSNKGTDDRTAIVPSDSMPSKQPRLAPGGLRGLVEDYLHEHRGDSFSPNQIGKALNRSSGAVNNALEKLVADGYAVKAQDKPKRFAATSEENISQA